MSSLPVQTFTFHLSESDSFDVKTALIDGEPWFVASDVCQALTVANSRDALSRLDDDEKGVGSIDTLGGAQTVGIVNESGLYSLVLGSRKPEAKKFKKWVTAEVLPAIRKTGSYSVKSDIQIPDFSNPAAAARAWADEFEKRQAAQQALAIAAPRLEFMDRYVDADGLKSFRSVCKMLKAGEGEFRAFLVEKRIMYKLGGEWTAYQPHLEAGRFEIKTGESNGHVYSRCLFTAKGAEWIAREWGGYQAVKLLK